MLKNLRVITNWGRAGLICFILVLFVWLFICLFVHLFACWPVGALRFSRVCFSFLHVCAIVGRVSTCIVLVNVFVFRFIWWAVSSNHAGVISLVAEWLCCAALSCGLFFIGGLLYESLRRKPGWRFTAGSNQLYKPFCSFGRRCPGKRKLFIHNSQG